MNLAGILAIGNGEKCPYCETILDENTDAMEHLFNNHPKEVAQAFDEI